MENNIYKPSELAVAWVQSTTLLCVNSPTWTLYWRGSLVFSFAVLLFPLWDTLSRYYSQMTSSLNLKGLLHMHGLLLHVAVTHELRTDAGFSSHLHDSEPGRERQEKRKHIQQPHRLWLVASPLFTSLMMSSAVSLALSQASLLVSVMSRASDAGSQLRGDTQGRRCPAHYHIITLPGVWDWTLATRLSQNALLLTNPTHLGTLGTFIWEKNRRCAKGKHHVMYLLRSVCLNVQFPHFFIGRLNTQGFKIVKAAANSNSSAMMWSNNCQDDAC